MGCAMFRFGHNRIPAPYMTICMHGNFPAKNTVRTYVHRMYRVGHNRIYTPYMTVYFVISLPKIPHIHRIYMVLANPTYVTMNVWFWPTLAMTPPNIRTPYITMNVWFWPTLANTPKYTYTVCNYECMVLANPSKHPQIYVHRM